MSDAPNSSGNSAGILSWLTRFLSPPSAAPATNTPRTPAYNGVQEAQQASDDAVRQMRAIGKQEDARQAAAGPPP